MNRIKRGLRLIVLILAVMMAGIAPVPINLYRKDDTPKNLIEQIDKDEEDDEEEVK